MHQNTVNNIAAVEVQVTVTEDDARAAGLWATRHSPKFRRTRILLASLPLTFYAIPLILAVSGKAHFPENAAEGIVLLIPAAISIWLWFRLTRVVRVNVSRLTEHAVDIVISAEGVFANVDGQAYAWRSVERWGSTSDHLFVLAANALIILPRRSFRTNEEFAACIQLVKRNVQATKEERT